MIRINMTINSRLLGKLDAEAKSLEISRSELIRSMLDHRYRRQAQQAAEHAEIWNGGKSG